VKPGRFHVDRAEVIVAPSAAVAGALAAHELATTLSNAVSRMGSASVILATGNSQLPFLAALRTEQDIPWDRITVFHMDEYVGMDEDHPASFRRYMREQVVEPLKPAAFHGIAGDADDPVAEMARYAGLLANEPPAACALGIGENGHVAFNDPPASPAMGGVIRIVELAPASRVQQVGEGHFPDLASVPSFALTLTIPAVLAPARVLANVPEARKAGAVREALRGAITPSCPASYLRDAEGVTIYLDRESAALL
jgi:glucosamine-6-phosphate deaminase